MDLIEHYLDHGAREGRSASASFDTQWYRARYPDVDASGLNPIIFHIRHGHNRDTVIPPRMRALLRLNIRRWSPIEAAIRTETRFHPLKRLPINASIPSVPLFQAWTRLFASLPAGIDRIVFVPWIVHSGADLASANMVKAAIDAYGVQSVLVVVTDAPRLEAVDWLPPGTLVAVLPLIDQTLGHEDRVRLTELIVFSLRPKAIMNVNSRACWDLFLSKGKALSSMCRLHAAMFCQDYTDSGVPIGYSDTHFMGTIDNIEKLYIDNSTFIQKIIADYQLPASYASKLALLRQPCTVGKNATRQVGGGKRMRVIWAGRFSKQKNTRLLERIVRCAPDIDFTVYGTGSTEFESRLTALSTEVGNLSLRGGYRSLGELPLQEFDAFLFTSLWEGLPTTVIHVGATELPIVASGVGGIQELIHEETGWRIDSTDDETMYAEALREIWVNKAGAERRAQRLRQLVVEQHSWSGFVAELSRESSFLSPSHGN
ncbi:glycosyltransferase family 4 protein [Ensifer sp. MJa1]|uniref:glycosyltransferase family 4 protein n=1 Tax=Ensifer sp. MJa1 TaxID=2919888 RepID=UPI0030097BCC